MRCIKIVAVVEFNKLAFANKRLPRLPLTKQIAALEQITVIETFSRHPLGRKHQNAFILEGEEVRALPHIAHLFFRLIKDSGIVPLMQVGGTIQAHLAGLAIASADYHVPAISFSPHLRIAEMVQTRRSIHHNPLALEVDPIAASRKTLHLIKVSLIAGIAMEFMPGINQRQRVAINNRRARETTVFIFRAFRSQRDRQVLPMNQIFTARMAPVHRPPLRGIRMVLVKSVIPTVKPDQTVRIVNPARTRGKMVARIPTQVQRFTFSLQFLFSLGY
ncbi:hypothetical protein D3C80_1257690 [compost metagenome]